MEGRNDYQANTAIQPPLPYKFSAEELRVLKECNEESFYQRCVPISTVLGLTTYVAAQRGIFQPVGRYGATPRVALAVIAGYFIGKFSYQQKCAEKLMAVPNSFIGQQLRSKQQGRFGQFGSPGMGGFTPEMPVESVTSGDIYSDVRGPLSSLNMDTDRPQLSDDYEQDNEQLNEEKSSITYEELRKQHRSSLEYRRQNPYRVDPERPPQYSSDSDAPQRPLSTNLYGDIN